MQAPRSSNQRRDARDVGGVFPTVLVVEDETLVRISIADHLREYGWNVLEASTADDAKSLVLSGATIDLLFSDVQMAGHMDGIELAQWMHGAHPDVPILLTSGIAGVIDIPVYLCAEGSFFFKPYDYERVAARIHALLG